MTPLELKTAFRVMQEELTALRDRVGALEAERAAERAASAAFGGVVRGIEEDINALSEGRMHGAEKPEAQRKLCPHCGEKPAYFFHVKNCQAKNKKNKGVNGEANGH